MRLVGARLKPSLALTALVLLGMGAGGCGGSSKTTTTVSAPTVSGFGHAADTADRRAVTALVGSYYAAAAAEQGARACGMLFFELAESVVEKYGRAPGPRYLNGATTCQAVLSRVFEHFHAQLQARPTVALVDVKGEQARALLEWSSLPAGYVEARREGATWKLDSLLALALTESA
jgi:hypothetical protein